MLWLCIDTTSDEAHVALSRDGQLVAHESWRTEHRHGEELFDRLNALLEAARCTRGDVRGIGVNVGPGGFTAVRVGLAAAKGIALVTGVPLVAVTSLRVAARAAWVDASVIERGSLRDRGVGVMLRAYRGEVYAGAYAPEADDSRPWREVVPATHGVPDDLVALFVGRGIEVAAEASTSTHVDALVREVHAQFAQHGASDLVLIEPMYLRPPDAKLPDVPLRT